MFRKEKTVPNISLASSSALRVVRDRLTLPFTVVSETGRDDLPRDGAVGNHLRL